MNTVFLLGFLCLIGTALTMGVFMRDVFEVYNESRDKKVIIVGVVIGFIMTFVQFLLTVGLISVV